MRQSSARGPLGGAAGSRAASREPGLASAIPPGARVLDRYRFPWVRLLGIRVLQRGSPSRVGAAGGATGIRRAGAVRISGRAGGSAGCCGRSAGTTGRPLGAAAGGARRLPDRGRDVAVGATRVCGSGMVQPVRGERSGWCAGTLVRGPGVVRPGLWFPGWYCRGCGVTGRVLLPGTAESRARGGAAGAPGDCGAGR